MDQGPRAFWLLYGAKHYRRRREGLVWMISTLITVDKRTEVMDVKIDHLVQAVETLTERQASYDQSWTDALSNLQASRGEE